jgi:hypothetical protein
MGVSAVRLYDHSIYAEAALLGNCAAQHAFSGLLARDLAFFEASQTRR